MVDHDPNGESYEAYIERMAGASPCEWLPMPQTDWPMPSSAPTTPPDDEDLEVPSDA